MPTGPAGMTEAERTLVISLGMAARSIRAQGALTGTGEWRYASLAEFLLREGRLFTPAPLPEVIAAGPPGRCFPNASDLADARDELVYVEGMAAAVAVLGYETPHAWCARPGDSVAVDPTWPAGDGAAYLGIPLTDAYRRRAHSEHEQWDIITGPAAVQAGRIGFPHGAIVLDTGRPVPADALAHVLCPTTTRR